MSQKKRKAKRVYDDDPEGERNLPVRKTSELVEQHKNLYKGDGKNKMQNPEPDFGNMEEGKELFDDILIRMSSPDNLSD